MKQRLILMMALSACAIGATAADFVVDGIPYDVVGHETVEIAAGGDYSGDFVIPTEVLFNEVDYVVRGIGKDAFHDCGSLTSVTIPESVTAISEGAFNNCSSLTAIKGKFASADNNELIVNGTLIAFAPNAPVFNYTIPKTVTKIGDYAFCGCNNIKAVTIPNNVKSIGDYAFSHCDNLRTVTIDDSVKEMGEAVFYHCENLKEVTLPNQLTAIKYNTFAEDASLTTITIPGSVKTIGSGAFYSSGLTEITLPSSVEEIQWAAFAACHYLQSVILNEGLTTIADQAFIGCGSLTEITIPDTVTSIGETAFLTCEALRTINSKFVSDDKSYMMVGNILMRVFPDAKLTSFTVPDNVTKIGVDAFKYCTDLVSVEIPASVTEIGVDAFDGCTSLQSITLPDFITYIQAHTFWGCHNLTSVTLPENLKVIQGDSFVDCYSLASIDLPEGLEGIDGGAFTNCVALTSLTLPQSIRSITGTAFSGCTSLSEFYGKYASEDHHCLINGDTMISAAFAGLTEFTVPEGVKHIEANCFAAGPGNLQTLNLPGTLETATWQSFAGLTHLTSITLPNSIKLLDSNAFERTGISEVTLPASIERLGNDVFAGSPLRAVTLESEDPWSVTIEDVNPFGSTDVMENGTLYVPAGTKDAYSSHWYWSQFRNIVEAESTSVNRFAGEPAKVVLDEVSLVPVTMVNEASVIGMQFDVMLPEGIALAQNDKGRYYLEGSDRFDDHYVTAQDIEGGVRFVVISGNNNAFDGHEGVLFSLPVIATGEKRQADILIRNILLSDDNYQEIKVAPMMLTANVQPAYTVGDVNNDGKFTVTDVTLVVAYVLGNDPANGIREAADANGDGRLTVTDVTIVVSYVLGQQQPKAPSRAKAVESEVSVAERSELALNDNGIVELSVSGLSACTSAQFDITLSEGAAVSGVSLRGEQDHVVTYRAGGDGTVRVLAYSPTNSDFAADAAFEIALEGTGNVDMAVAGIRLAQVCGNAVDEFAAEGCSASYDLSGIADSMLAGLSVRTVAGGLLVTAPEACDITLYDTLGRGSRHALSAGANRIALPRGVYMLAGRKLVIR